MIKKLKIKKTVKLCGSLIVVLIFFYLGVGDSEIFMPIVSLLLFAFFVLIFFLWKMSHRHYVAPKPKLIINNEKTHVHKKANKHSHYDVISHHEKYK